MVIDNFNTSIQICEGLKQTKFPPTLLFGEVGLSYFESHFTQFVPDVAEVLLDVDVIVVADGMVVVALDVVMEVVVTVFVPDVAEVLLDVDVIVGSDVIVKVVLDSVVE